MSNFLNEFKNQSLFTETQNGADAYITTQSALLDFFAEAGALRNVNKDRIIRTFDKALNENPLLTMKCLFYYRDIREGQGERRLFRVIINHLAKTRPELIKINLELIPFYGRYDDLLELLDTPLSDDVISLIKAQIEKDMNASNPSLLAKWMPSCDTSSKETVRKATLIRKKLGLKEKEYRKMLSNLREKIRVTERLISQNRWDELELDKLTANNYMKYSNSFRRNIPEKWDDYMSDVKEGKTSVKSSTLYPYNITNKARYADRQDSALCDELWKALPDYTNGQMESMLPMVDVSGSMGVRVSGEVTAMDVAISLGLYISERVKGPFNNYFLTFSERPQVVEIKGNSLQEKMNNMENESWGMSTDLVRAFELILNLAVETNATQDEIPKKLVIISDMQFDSAFRYTDRKRTLLNNIKERFESNGYSMPTVVFWNVNSPKVAFQVSKDDKNVLLCSGCSPVILSGVLKYNNPMELVLETLNAPRYKDVKVEI